jgi:hypothetical protein
LRVSPGCCLGKLVTAELVAQRVVRDVDHSLVVH